MAIGGNYCFRMVIVGLVLSGLSAGCAPAVPTSFTELQEMQGEDFPENHRAQINEALRQYFGTPANPRFRLPSEDDSGDEIALVDAVDPDSLKLGAEVYQQRCAKCHGVSGDGEGEAAAFLFPKPRDYRRGLFKFTSTTGQLKPRRDDLVLTLRRGVKGTSMPKFPHISDRELRAVVDYVIMLSVRGEMESLLVNSESPDIDPDDFEPAIFANTAKYVHSQWERAEDPSNLLMPHSVFPARTDERLVRGQQLFLDEATGCWKCHGKDGRGQVFGLNPVYQAEQLALEPTFRQISVDVWGNLAPAADLTTGMFHGGRRPLDIYRRIYAGVKGTPMAGNGETRFKDDPEKIWDLVHYVLAVSKGTAPPVPAEANKDTSETPGEAAPPAETEAEPESG